MESLALTAADDHRHSLDPGEHEAFYFPFTAPDGTIHGFLRTLFDREEVLEIVALHVDGRAWAHQQRAPLPPDPPPPTEGSGPSLKLTCQEPWRSWRCRFHGEVSEVGGTESLPVNIDLTFTALNEPERYTTGTYHQAQQDGQLSGHLRIGERELDGRLSGYRDHSWGHRPLGMTSGWTILDVPGRFYIGIAQMGERSVFVGRIVQADGSFIPVKAPTIIQGEERWGIEDPQAGMAAWTLHRLAPPLIAHLGKPGEEALSLSPQPTDLYRDEIGPALFTSPRGTMMVGFLEHARRLE